jgi:hypothetical protein
MVVDHRHVQVPVGSSAMAFHVEIGGGLNHARAFNLSADELAEAILRPWLAGHPIRLGDRDWEPRKSTLRILEGPHLDTPDLSFGQGWSNAERVSEDVTKRELAAAPRPHMPDAFVVEAELPEATVAEMLSGQDAIPVPLGQARARLDGRAPQVAAVILVTNVLRR